MKKDDSMSETSIDPNPGKLTDVLISAKQIQDRVTELGRQIAHDYADRGLVMIGILKGSFIFMADLARALYEAQHKMGLPESQVFCDFLTLQSYGDQTYTSGVVRISGDLSRSVEGKHVLVVEDIVDTGLSMNYLLNNLSTRNPASVRLCSLIHKPSRTVAPVTIDYLGFTIEDHFVVGYGLDHKQSYRNLPYLAIVEP